MRGEQPEDDDQRAGRRRRSELNGSNINASQQPEHGSDSPTFRDQRRGSAAGRARLGTPLRELVRRVRLGQRRADRLQVARGRAAQAARSGGPAAASPAETPCGGKPRRLERLDPAFEVRERAGLLVGVGDRQDHVDRVSSVDGAAGDHDLAGARQSPAMPRRRAAARPRGRRPGPSRRRCRLRGRPPRCRWPGRQRRARWPRWRASRPCRSRPKRRAPRQAAPAPRGPPGRRPGARRPAARPVRCRPRRCRRDGRVGRSIAAIGHAGREIAPSGSASPAFSRAASSRSTIADLLAGRHAQPVGRVAVEAVLRADRHAACAPFTTALRSQSASTGSSVQGSKPTSTTVLQAGRSAILPRQRPVPGRARPEARRWRPAGSPAARRPRARSPRWSAPARPAAPAGPRLEQLGRAGVRRVPGGRLERPPWRTIGSTTRCSGERRQRVEAAAVAEPAIVDLAGCRGPTAAGSGRRGRGARCRSRPRSRRRCSACAGGPRAGP